MRRLAPSKEHQPTRSPTTTITFAMFIPAFVLPRHSIQVVLREKLRHYIDDLNVVQVGEWNARVAADADFRQVHERCVAAMSVDGLHPQLGQCQAHSPVVLAEVLRRLLGNVLVVVDDDGMRVSLANPSLGTGMPSSGPVKLGMDGGSSP